MPAPCQSVIDWPLSDGRHACADCGRRVSPTAGTIFHRTRTPLTVWFDAAWLMTKSKAGTSALNLQRVLELGSYQTAWTMLHRWRGCCARRGSLTDESYSGMAHVTIGQLRRSAAAAVP